MNYLTAEQEDYLLEEAREKDHDNKAEAERIIKDFYEETESIRESTNIPCPFCDNTPVEKSDKPQTELKTDIMVIQNDKL